MRSGKVLGVIIIFIEVFFALVYHKATEQLVLLYMLILLLLARQGAVKCLF